MAENSRREQILLSIISVLENMSSIQSVGRKQPNAETGLRRIPGTQLPRAVVLGGIPQPVPHKSGRDGTVDIFRSILEVKMFFYFMDNTDPDSTFSSLLDDAWAALYADQRFGLNFVVRTVINPHPLSAIWPPYGMFAIIAKVIYFHTKGGI